MYSSLESYYSFEPFSSKRKEKFTDMVFTHSHIPFVVICYNNLTFVKNFVNQLKRFPNPIILLDNKSSFAPMFSYYDNIEDELKSKIKIHRLDQNYGHRVYSIRPDLLPEQFILSDPDLQLHPDMPLNVADILMELSTTYQAHKVGSALDISDHEKFIKCPNYTLGMNIHDWESQFWKNPMPHDKYKLYNADIDTTFCLVNQSIQYGIKIRVAGNFTAKHLPWYENYIIEHIPKDELNHWIENNTSSSILFTCLNLNKQ